MNRTLNVVRLQFVNKQTFLWIPLIVLVGAFVIALLVFSLIPADGPMYSGAAQAPLWYFAIIGSQALTLTFPFAQAMSLTRREFYLGSLAAAAISAAAMATVFTMSLTRAPRERSFTGMRRPCSTGPTATASADRWTAL